MEIEREGKKEKGMMTRPDENALVLLLFVIRKEKKMLRNVWKLLPQPTNYGLSQMTSSSVGSLSVVVDQLSGRDACTPSC